MVSQLKSRILILMIISLSIIAMSCNSEDPNAKYLEDMKTYRHNEKEFFRNSEDSPVVDMTDKTIPFYYEPKPEYKVEAYLDEFADKDTLEMLTTQSDVRKMIRYGDLKFKVNGEKFSLTAYVNIEHPESFFIPFHDETNGKETYEAGRYLELEIVKDSKYILDFNLAYNPYCYYNAKYSCPIVPEDNYLKTKIEAGEKSYNDSH